MPHKQEILEELFKYNRGQLGYVAVHFYLTEFWL
jgi:hypothetical protein